MKQGLNRAKPPTSTYETDQSDESFISSLDDFSLSHSQGCV